MTSEETCGKLGTVSKEDTTMATAIETTAKTPKLTEAFGKKAHKNHEAILAVGAQVSESFLVLGALLKDNRDEQYFKAYGHEKFAHYLGSPEVGVSRSMAFGLIQVVELYIDKLGRDPAELAKAGIGKLLTIAPVVELNPDEWLAKCTMSRSDLKLEVDEARGIEPKELPPAIGLEPDVIMAPAYVDWVRAHPCIVCGKEATDEVRTHPHHFPTTKGAGRKAVSDHVIPLCGECHTEAHEDPVKWMVTYKAKWGAYLFGLILSSWPTASDPNGEVVVMEPVKGTFVRHEGGKSFDVEVRESLAFTSMEVADGAAMTPEPTPLVPEEDEISADAALTPDELRAKYPEEEVETPKRMEGFSVAFSQCSGCRLIKPESELEGGMCKECWD